MTPRQSQLLSILRERALAGDVAPSFEEMMAAIGASSKGAVHRLIECLETSGKIKRVYSESGTARARMIYVVGIDEYSHGYCDGFAAAQAQGRAA